MTRLPINVLILISSLLGMYLFMSWTSQSSWNCMINYLYVQNTTKSLNQQFQIIVYTGYYLVLFSLVVFAQLNLYKYYLFKKKPEEIIDSNPLIKTTYDAFKNSFYEFVTFMCIYFYFARNHHKQVSQKQLILIPFWFLCGRLFYVAGYILTTISQINLKHYGATLTLFTYAVMLSEIGGHSLFKYL